MTGRIKCITTWIAAIFSMAILLTGCSGGTILVLSEIQGPGILDENSAADFSVQVTGGDVGAYAWTADSSDAGYFTNANMSSSTFHAYEVTVDITVTLTVTVTSEKKTPPCVVSRDVTIFDTNQMPRAAAHSDKTTIGHGQSVQFFDDSTDPEGDDDIVKWEWDFSYDEDDGFSCDSQECEPIHQFDDPGTYHVQLRITDRSSIIDMLTQPLAIEVVENYGPVISAVTHSRTTSQAGNDNESVQLGVVFTDSAPFDDTHTWLWTCDYGSFDDPLSATPAWFPPDVVTECDISVRVTDWFGLNDQAGCHQWVTSLPTRFNSSVPGNVIPSHNLPTAFSGTINPATYMFPYDPADGNVVFMSYWATYSSASTDGIPNLLEVYNHYNTADYVHIMINEGETGSDVVSFVNLNLYEASFWALDQDATYFGLTRGWADNSSTIPQSMLFDRDGRCRWMHVDQLTSTTGLESAIEELL